MSLDKPFSCLFLLARPKGMPGKKLLETLSADVIERGNGFLSKPRTLEYFWSRLILNYIIEKKGLLVSPQERAPLSPLLEGQGKFYTSISHTKTYIAVAVSSLPIAIDIEIVNPNRPIEAMWKRLFTQALWEKTPKDNRVLSFYQNWGLHECAVKLSGTLDINNEGVQILYEGKNASMAFIGLPKKTLLTLVTSREVPVELTYVQETDLVF